MIFRGSGVALITPFNEDLSINFEKLGELIDFHIENKTDALILLGTTGESATITDEEKIKIIDFAISKTKNKIPLIVGTGSNSTIHAIQFSKLVASKGVDGLLIVTPYYNKASQEGLFLHYKEIANSVPNTPIILYNVPSRTGVNLEIDTILKLAKIPNIVGIKEANPDISRVAILKKNLKKNEFAIYSGNDDLTLPFLSLGADGVISVLANILPKEVYDICDLYWNNYIEKSRKLYLDTIDLCKNLFIDINPIPIKEAMNYLGFSVGNCRLPLCNMNNINEKSLFESIELCHKSPQS